MLLFDNRLFDNQLDIYESLYMPDQKSWNNNVNNVRFSVIIPVGWVGSFCFNLILCILSFQAISFQILLYALFRRFPWLTLLLFPSYFKLHNLTYLIVNVLMDNMTIPSQTDLNYHIFDLHNNTHHILKHISWHPIDQSHPTHHPDHATLHPKQPCLIRNSKSPCFITVQQNCSTQHR